MNYKSEDFVRGVRDATQGEGVAVVFNTVGRDILTRSIADAEHKKLSAVKRAPFDYTADVLHDYWTYLHREWRKFDPWLKHDDPAVAVSARKSRRWRDKSENGRGGRI